MGGISCIACYPPKKPEHVLLRLISEAGVWTTPDQAFYTGSDNLGSLQANHSPDLTSPPQAETGHPAAAGQPTAAVESPHTASRVVVRRKLSEPYVPTELAWVVCDGGILDQMAESLRTRRIAVSRSGETLEEISERLAKFRNKSHSPRKLAKSNQGAVPAEILTDLRFVAEFPAEQRRFDHFSAGTKCLLFPGRVIPRNDPQADDLRESLEIHKKNGRRLAAIRLPVDGGMLRMVDEQKVAIV